MSMDGKIDFIEADLVCRTEGCENEGAAIRMGISSDAENRLVICGACGQEITDITERQDA